MEKALYDLTNPQKSIWYTEEFYKGTSIENIGGTTFINDIVDFDKLKKAINIFTKNSDGFRLKFIKENNNIKQYISDFEELSFNVAQVDTIKDVKKIEKEYIDTPFNIFNSLLFKFQLFKFKNGHGGFVVVGHHLIVDAWACGLVISDILEIYNQLLQNIEPEFSSYSYLDYITSEKDYLASNKFQKDKEFWNKEFAIIPEVATIPSFISTTSTSSNAKRKTFKIPSETINLISTYCKKNKVSPYNFFMGAYSLYLSRVSNLDEFVIGTPILNRGNIKEKHTIGVFISVVPFKIHINEENSFTSFLEQVSSDFFSVYKHQKYPYQMLLEDLRKQNPGIPNLFNIMFSYQNMRTDTKKSITPYETRWAFNGNISDDIDIHFFDINDTGMLDVAYDYKTSKYTQDDIYALHSRILHIINQILENNEILLKDIEIVTPDEKNKILYEFNNTDADYPKDKTITQLFEEQVEKTPDNIAVVFEDQKLTYKELNEKANSLANYLRNYGISRNDLVGIMVNRSLEMIIAILAVLKAGGAYIPIDPSYPKDRIEYMLNSSTAKVVLTQKKLENLISFNDKLFIDLDNTPVYSWPKNNSKNINLPEDLAYVIFTSGSTGWPKGVMLRHNNVINFNTGMIQEFNFSSKDTIASITTISFDIFVLESLIPLLNGLKIIITSENEQTNVELFNKLCIKNKVNIIQTTPSRMQLFTDSNSNIDFIKNATYVLIGGEPFPFNLLNKLKTITSAKIYNMYGPTETTVWSSMNNMSNSSIITIGQPISNTQIYILDKNKNPLPYYVPGELYISGDGVGNGYLNNKELTNQCFINNPFLPNTIMYKTGDLGFFIPNGEIVCIGRSDNQVKIRGLRIELNEIEENILALSDILSCVVIKKEDNSSHEFLCAYYTSKNRKLDVKYIRKHLEKNLPSYMIPQYFVYLKSLPYTPNGKVDIKNLPTPEINNEFKKIILPRNTTDKKVIAVLTDLLGVKSISIYDNFFELGGDSLSAINLCTKIKNEFNAEIFVKDILEHPQIQDLSDLIYSKINNIISENIPVIPSSAYYQVSSAQKRIYFASTMAGDNNILYNIPGGVILNKQLDSKKLKNCLNILINRHESLRTYFELDKDTVVQKILDNIDFKLKIINNVKFEDLNVIFKDFLKPFDLSKAPLFRASLVYFTDGKSALLIDIHHIISDGTSLSIIIDELCKLYNDENLQPIQITYKDFAAFENKKLISDEIKEAESYWVHQFKDEIPVLDLPTQFPRPTVQSFEGKKIYSSINVETFNKIKSLAKKLEVTPYMILLATYYILLYKYTSQEDIVAGTPIVGRNIAETYNVVGMFVNTLALRGKIDRNNSFKQFLLTLKETLLSSYKYQTYPFDELVKKLEIKRDPSRNPLFDTMFIYQNNGYKALHFNNIKSEIYNPDIGITKFDLSVEIIPNNNGADISFEYATKLFEEDFISNMCCHYLNILNSILENIDTKISEIDMLSIDEKNKILYEFNNTKVDYPKNKTISQLFEEQVEKTPDNIAVVFEDQKLTYKELNEKANSLAKYLTSLGISKKTVIPVIINRSLELIISLFGIIKCGCIYLPIAPDTPSERINYILENCHSKIVITPPIQKVIFSNDIKIVDIQNFNFAKYNNNNLYYDIHPQDLLYIIYTSGSSGRPKGVQVCHNNLVNFIYSFNSLFDNISPKDRLLASTNISFDVSIFEIFMPLLNGATLYLYDEPNITDIFKYCKALVKNKISFTYIPPNILEEVYNILSSNSSISLNKILLGVEPIKSSTIKKYYTLNPNMKIINAYGPTEATICATAITVNNDILKHYKTLPIGHPLQNLKIYILDRDMHPTPIGVPGEIYISGANVSHGYLNNKELTQKYFINIPHLNCKNAYKTGDLAKWDENGVINFIGRNDYQIKINGHRIELGEIENCIYSYPNIDKAVVLLNNKKLNCYFSSSKHINIIDLIAFIQRKVPSYFIPNYFIQIDNFKLTSNGKIDRQALQKIQINTANIFVPPETEYQKKLVSAFEAVLGIKHIGITDNFFELGGDSLLAIKLQIKAFNNGLDLSYKDIFNYPTVKQLSENVKVSQKNKFNDTYNYTQINSFLAKNTFNIGNLITREKFKNILLTGATGFMGSHILDALFKKTKCNIYCLVRPKDNNDPYIRLLNTLRFYFGNKYDKEIFKRLFVIEGDVSKNNLGIDEKSQQKLGFNIDCVINSAAIVKHYGNLDTFTQTNIQGAKNIIEFCSKYNCKLIHLSTLSVSGNIFGTDNYQVADLSKNIIFNEQKLYIGQDLSNIYIYTKFIAERLILENIINGKLDGKIIRLGNITNRFSDGLFQINVSENAFLNRINSILHIGCIPDYLLDKYVEFSPVDICAEAILKLTFYKSNISIYHVYNNHHIKFRELIKILKNLKIPLEIVNKETFNKKIKSLAYNEETKNIISGIINDFDKNKELNYNTTIKLQNKITNKLLRTLSFKWPKINEKYLKKYIIYLKSIGYIK